MITNNSFDYKELTITNIAEEKQHTHHLIVWNDDVNTFEWVIECLIEVCQHTEEQAEQCAMLIHFQGKYAVKNGDEKNLLSMCDALLNRNINATVEIMANK